MKIPVILGPTSSGKTSLAIKLCTKLNGEIISADSRQIYKFMDVGTGKVPIGKDVAIERKDDFWVLDNVKVWGYDLVTPDEDFSAYDFAKFGLTVAGDLTEKSIVPFLVGGTGLYIDFFTHRIKDIIGPPDLELRKELEKKNLKGLQQDVRSLNLLLNTSDFNNKRRLVRILERNKTSKSPTPLPYLENAKFVFIGLTASRDFLYKRVDGWVDSIWEDDIIVTEVSDLISLGYVDSRRISGLIYGNAVDFLNTEKTREEAVQKTKFNLHAYIRRQQTYFKRNKAIKWFDVTQDNLTENVYNYIKNFESRL